MATILLVEDDADLREVLVELIESFGNACLATGSLRELHALGDAALEADLALVDVNLGAGVPSGLDVWTYLRAEGFRGEIVFLTGHAASHPLVREALQTPHVGVLSKPLGLSELERLVTRLPVPHEAHAP